MSGKVSPDVAQAMTTKIFHGLNCKVYMDGCGLWLDSSFKEHVEFISSLIELLAKTGMKYNPLKCNWAVKEVDFLGYWMTPTAIKYRKSKVDAI